MPSTIARAAPAPNGAAPLPAAPPRWKRGGVPNLAAAWTRLRAASAPGAGELEFETPAPTGPTLPFARTVPLPTYGPVAFGPVNVVIKPRVTLRGAITYIGRGAAPTLAAAPASFGHRVHDALGTIALTGGIEPGKTSRVGIKLGTELVEIEFAAQADLRQPFRVSVKPKQPIAGTYRFGDWTFSGELVPSVDALFSPNPAWPGWGPAVKGTLDVGRAIVVAGRGLFFAGELGVATAFGAAAVGASVAVGGILWVGMSLYLIGKANLGGRERGFGNAFASGYSRRLARMTSETPLYEDTPAGRNAYWNDLSADYATEYEYWSRLYIEDRNKQKSGEALGHAYRLGGVAAVQDQAMFLAFYGAARWRATAARHRRDYGEDEEPRSRRYRDIMYRQLDAGDPMGVPLVPPS